MVFNASSNCSKGIEQLVTYFVSSECRINNWIDPALDKWEETTIPKNETVSEVKETLTNRVVHCFGSLIEIEDIKQRCPSFAFRLPLSTKFKLDNRTYNLQRTSKNIGDAKSAIDVAPIAIGKFKFASDFDFYIKAVQLENEIDALESEKQIVVVVRKDLFFYMGAGLMLMGLLTTTYLLCHCKHVSEATATATNADIPERKSICVPKSLLHSFA